MAPSLGLSCQISLQFFCLFVQNLYSELASECTAGSLDLQSRKTACEVLKYVT